MSSRNEYLNKSQKQLSSEIYKAIEKAATMVRAGVNSFDEIEKNSSDLLEELGLKVEYFSIRRRQDLKLVTDTTDKSLIILVAAWIGDTRLIDNLQVDI
jgi:pantoate--beta-alanine ligase